MCLLIVVFGLDPGAPLVVAANRDERLDRPATALTVLRDAAPRVLGGRDEQAGGTWLAVNDRGVVAGLTNRPSPDGRDPTKRSRGELPLALAGHADASGAVADLVARVAPRDYNPAWLLVGDRHALFALDMTGDGRVEAEELAPGIYILENAAIRDPSAKVDRVRALLGDAAERRGEELLAALCSVLGDHSVPDGAGAPAGTGSGETVERPARTMAACVHGADYGTRSSTVVAVPAELGRTPQVRVADGHPCTAPFVDVTHRWIR